MLKPFLVVPFLVVLGLQERFPGEPLILSLVFVQAFAFGYLLTRLFERFTTRPDRITSLKE